MLIILALMAFSGCGKNESGDLSDGKLTRAEYVGLLGDSFGFDFYITEDSLFSDVSTSNEYYAAIQSAAEWEAIDAGGRFNPDDVATLQFAIESAVRAIDVNKIEKSGANINKDDLVGFYVNNIAAIDVSNLDKSIDVETAKSILAYAENYCNNLVLPQVTDMELCDGVIESPGNIILNADGCTGTITVGSYNVGDVVYFDGSDGTLARSIKITSIDGNHFTFDDATLEETFKSLYVSGTFDGRIVEVTTATSAGTASYGRDLLDEMNAYGMNYSSDSIVGYSEDDFEVTDLGVKPDIGSDHAIFTVPIYCEPPSAGSYQVGDSTANYTASGNAELVFGIKDISVTVDYSHDGWKVWKPKDVDFRLNYTSEVSFDASGYAGTTIPLGDMVIQVWGPLNVKVSLVANIGLDGQINISYTAENVASARWTKGKGLSTNMDSTPHLDAQVEATLTIEGKVLAELRVGVWKAQYGIANAQVVTGIVAVGKRDVDLLGDQPDCTDILAFVPLRVAVNQKACAITDINNNWKKEWVVWDSESSPFKLHFHFEDGQRTPGDECTRGENEVVTEDVDESGEPYDEYKIFDFVPMEFDFVELVTYTMFLDIGEDGTIQITNIPEGYSESDLVFSSDDTSVCKVKNGTVTGVSAGSTLVRIGTSDGAYEVTLAVTVRDDYSIDGGFVSL